MIDEPDLLMEYNKDITRKEAEKIVKKNKEVRDEQLNNMFNKENPMLNEDVSEDSQE